MDVADMVGEHPSYHQAIKRDEAKRRLAQNGGHCYLTQYSKDNNCCVPSVHEEQLPPMASLVAHFKIVMYERGMLKLKTETRLSRVSSPY